VAGVRCKCRLGRITQFTRGWPALTSVLYSVCRSTSPVAVDMSYTNLVSFLHHLNRNTEYTFGKFVTQDPSQLPAQKIMSFQMEEQCACVTQTILVLFSRRNTIQGEVHRGCALDEVVWYSRSWHSVDMFFRNPRYRKRSNQSLATFTMLTVIMWPTPGSAMN
jgi:hypothetical protein